jgi:serine/threonine protein kinase/tetratricopeptide (TPR) repeat protein
MKTASSVCRRCGAKISNDATLEICPACLLRTGLDRFDGDSIADVVDPGRNDGVPVLDGRKAARSARHGESVPRRTKILSNFGDYELLEEIGRGGQGIVYRAHQKSLNRTVALKVIGLGPWTTEAHLKRFRREAEAAASLDHPSIVPIYEVGERDGQCYFSMKLVEGGQLDEVVRREPMPIRQAAELIAKVARTVHYAHEHGILHRDIKPGNILLDKNGGPHLTDFGLARLVETESTVTGTLEVLGTPSYMAPEQAAGETTKVSKVTDIYGLGAVLYQLLTGQSPFAGGTTYETIKLVLETEPRQPRLLNPKVDRDLSTICLKCLEKDPKRRYSSALALAEDLEHWLKHEPIQAHRTGIFTRGRKWVRRNPTSTLLATSLIALAGGIGWNVWKSEFIPDKVGITNGIAVLPFENLSNDREDASFADGVQDDILTKLARISHLKVISRTSVMGYRGKQNAREIGDALRVSHLLEGSVRKTGAWLHINMQLIDARTDSHVWAEEYDRDLKDMFAAQSEIAHKVAEHLNVKISPAERLDIDRPPTANIAAFELYSRGKNLILTSSFANQVGTQLLHATDLLNHAIERDPSFFDAHCQLSYAHDLLYNFGVDHSPARLASAEAAIKGAFRLRPDAGEAHLARALNLYLGHLDYNGALAELEAARQTLPNDPQIFEFKGYIERRQGRWEESTRDLERAIDLDPRNARTLTQAALTYLFFRRHAELKSLIDRASTVVPNDLAVKAIPAVIELYWKADTRPLRQFIDSTRATNPAGMPSVADYCLFCALAEHDAGAAENALLALPENGIQIPIHSHVNFSRAFVEGLIARMAKDDAKAQVAFTAARTEQEKIIQAQPNYGPALCALGLIDAALGRKQEALREGRRAVELLSPQKDAFQGPISVEYLAMIAAWSGDKDLACEQLAAVIRGPSDLSYGQLKLMPWWDPLRGDPRFEKIVEEAKQPLELR